MLNCDWKSDVCSSDLRPLARNIGVRDGHELALMVRGGAERFDRTSDDTHGRVFPLFAALQNDLQGPAMPSGARTQPQFSGHTYRLNRSKCVVHAKQQQATSHITN